jgi:hypothetical protein
VSSWVSVLEQLAALDPADLEPADLSDEQLREIIPRAQIGINRLAAMQTRAVDTGEARNVHAGDGMPSMKTWLTGHCRISGREAAGVVRAARRLRNLPALAAAYAAGAVTPAHVGVVTAAVTPARVAKAVEHEIDLIATDGILTDAALSLGPRTPPRRYAAGRPASTPTAPWTTLPDCLGCSGWVCLPAGGRTCPGIWIQSVPRRCTRRWKRP